MKKDPITAFVDSQITYKGYVGTISFSEQDRVYYGKVLDIPDLVSYEGATLEELTADFQDAVNDYLAIKADEKNQKINMEESK